MRFKEMDQAEVLALLEGEQDILTPLVEADEKVYKGAICPRCGGDCATDLNVSTLFDVDPATGDIIPGPRMTERPIPRKLCRCMRCRCLFDPFSGVILELGNLGEVEPDIPIIHGD